MLFFMRKKEQKKGKKETIKIKLIQSPVRLPIDLHTQFKIKLAQERKTSQDCLIELIKNYIEKK